MRDIETIDAELRLLARAWRLAWVLSDRIPITAHIDELLDERAAALDRALSPPAANGPGSPEVDQKPWPPPLIPGAPTVARPWEQSTRGASSGRSKWRRQQNPPSK
jgi:hypothetical protein